MRAVAAAFARDARGATAIEYGVIAALIATTIILGANGLGTMLELLWNNVQTNTAEAFTPAATP